VIKNRDVKEKLQLKKVQRKLGSSLSFLPYILKIMGQKIHPLGFRLGITQKHRSQWFIREKEYSQLIVEDFFIRNSLFSSFLEAGITEIEIQRKLDQIQIEIQAARPGILIGRDGKGLENLRKTLENKLKIQRNTQFYFYKNTFPEGFENPQIAIHVTKLVNPDREAHFLADFLVEQLQKRTAFRRAIKQTLQRAQRADVKGIKIQVSGRLNGAEIARSEWVREGRVPLQTLRADIDYSYRTAKTIYGIIGIKIWIFKGEILTLNH
jgi:small subunit ribosomal protein S3